MVHRRSIEAQFGAFLSEMASLQRAHNEQVHPKWENQDYPYLRAVWIECAEALDHYGWKWWMRQPQDLDQVRLELVDIWHFGLSEMIRDSQGDLGTMARQMVEWKSDVSKLSFCAAVERLAEGALGGVFDLRMFMQALNALPMTLAELYGTYVGKNALNRFRQEHGYAQGNYIKIWEGREDNIHLAELVRELDPEQNDFQVQVADALRERYDRVVGQQHRVA